MISIDAKVMQAIFSVCSIFTIGSLVGLSLVGFREVDSTLRPMPSYDIRTVESLEPQGSGEVKTLRARPKALFRAGDDPLPLARVYLQRTLGEYGVSNVLMEDLHLVSKDISRRTGLTHLHFQQYFSGVKVFQCGVSIHLGSRGQVLSLSGSVASDFSISVIPSISLEEATRIAATHLDVSIRTLATPGNLVVFPVPSGTAYLAWRLTVHKGMGEWYEIVVDAHSGDILYRVNLYKFADLGVPPIGSIFDPNPDVGPQVIRAFEGDSEGSPEGWVRGELTRGNNVIVREDVGGDDEIFPGRLARATDGRFDFPFFDSYATTEPKIHDSSDFDLDKKSIHLVPEENGYSIDDIPFSFTRSLGVQLDLENNDSIEVTFENGFTFPLYGTVYRSVFVNSNGNLTFGFGDSDSQESAAKLTTQFPRIAPLWTGLDVQGSGGVFLKQNAKRMVITWNQVSQDRELALNTFQVILDVDGVIRFSYDGVATQSGLVGISPGGVLGGADSEVDFTAEVPFSFASSDPVVEQFPTERSRLTGYFSSLEDQAIGITNLFYWVNFMHDYLYELGFTEEAGNFQESNFEHEGDDGDRLLADVQDGRFSNNAAIAVPPDGQSPRMAMGLFSRPFRDSAFDSDVILHEYAHGLTERLVGGPRRSGCLNGLQSGALGEGWSDFYAITILSQPVIGEYITGNEDVGIRRFDYSKSPLRFGDFGNLPAKFQNSDRAGIGDLYTPELHDDGEIWATVLWELRERLGKSITELLVTEALKLTPCNPTMLDARDAIFLADEAINNSANHAEMWEVFASRGFGKSASLAYDINASDADNMTAIFQAFDTATPIENRNDVNLEVIFEEDFERSIRPRGWEIEGEDGLGGGALWHRSSGLVAGGARAAYYGVRDGNTYETEEERNFGALTSPAIDLSGVKNAVLQFDHILRAERALPFDPAIIRVSVDDGDTFQQLAFLFNDTRGARFQQARFNLEDFSDKKIRIQFYFDTLDGRTNKFGGWLIDNVVIRGSR